MSRNTGEQARLRWYTLTVDKEQTSLAQERSVRSLEVSTILASLRRLYYDEVAASSSYLPIRFLTDGVDAYLYVFDNAAIYYASLAVELALMTRLGEKGLLSNRPPDFGHLIDSALDSQLITRTAHKRAHKVRKIRNSYVHYYNVARLSAKVNDRSLMRNERQAPKAIKSIKERVRKEEQAAMVEFVNNMKTDLSAYDLVLQARMPRSQVEPNTQCQALMARRLPHHVRWILKARDDPEEFKRRWAYGIERQDALDCLQWSATTLRALRFL